MICHGQLPFLASVLSSVGQCIRICLKGFSPTLAFVCCLVSLYLYVLHTLRECVPTWAFSSGTYRLQITFTHIYIYGGFARFCRSVLI